MGGGALFGEKGFNRPLSPNIPWTERAKLHRGVILMRFFHDLYFLHLSSLLSFFFCELLTSVNRSFFKKMLKSYLHSTQKSSQIRVY